MSQVVQSQSNREQEIFSAIQSFAREHAPNRYAQIGSMALEVQDEALWIGRADSFDKWLRGCSGESYSTIRAAMRECSELLEMGVPPAVVSQIRHGNFAVMKQLSSAVQALPEVQQAATQADPADFAAYLSDTQPSQHIERKETIKIAVPASVKALWDDGLSKAKERGDADGPVQFIEKLLSDYADDLLLESGYEDALTPLTQ